MESEIVPTRVGQESHPAIRRPQFRAEAQPHLGQPVGRRGEIRKALLLNAGITTPLTKRAPSPGRQKKAPTPFRHQGGHNCPHCGQKWGSRGSVVPGSFPCFVFVSFPLPWKAAQIPPTSRWRGTRSASLGKPHTAAHRGQHGATSAFPEYPDSALPGSPRGTPPESGPNAPDSRCSSWE